MRNSKKRAVSNNKNFNKRNKLNKYILICNSPNPCKRKNNDLLYRQIWIKTHLYHAYVINCPLPWCSDTHTSFLFKYGLFSLLSFFDVDFIKKLKLGRLAYSFFVSGNFITLFDSCLLLFAFYMFSLRLVAWDLYYWHNLNKSLYRYVSFKF